MASNVVSIAVQANSESLTQAFDKGATSGERFKAKMQLVAQAVVAALAFKAAQAVKDFVGDSVRAFSDLNESLNAVEVSFGRNAEGIKKLGEEAAQNLGLSNAEFNSFAVQISAFAQQIAGDGGDVVGVVDELSTRVTDFASVMNLDVAEAAEKFQSGLAGESEPLRKFGIDVSAAKVEAFALANGIGTAGEELTEAEKVTARYGAIMEQTEKVQGDFARTADDYANAQRIANAEMENAKARAGEALVPFAQLTAQLKELGAKTIGILSTEILGLTGSMSQADEAIQRFEIHMGRSADTAEAALTIAKDYKGSIDELIPRLDLSRKELERLRDADEDFLKSLGFTEAQIDDLADVLKTELASSLTDSEQQARDFFNANQDLNESLGDQEDAIYDVIAANRAATDPVANSLRAARELRDAQAAYNDALIKHGPASQEAEDAALDLLDAQNDLDGSLKSIAEEGGPNWREEFRRVASQAGLADEQIDNMIASVERADGMSANVNVRAQITAPNFRYVVDPDTGQARPRHTGTSVFQHGGIVTDPTVGLIGEAGSDEAVIPLNNEGIKILGAALREAMGGGTGGVQVFVSGSVLTEHDLVEAVERGLQAKARRNGSLGI